MCGFAGFVNLYKNTSEADLAARAEAMADVLRHRGPDDGAVWADARAGVALGHRRLSILDLSPQGRQPMLSADGRWVIAFNGEVYNFLEIKKELESRGLAPAWRGRSDTEVLLAAISAWGLEASLTRMNGMFALALWDRKNRTLHLARDRMGKKPLYYGWAGRGFLFASELKAIRTHPDFNASLDQDAIALFLRHGYIPSPYCVYRGFKKLSPGHRLSFNPSGGKIHPVSKPYWSLAHAAQKGLSNPITGDAPEVLERMEDVLSDAVRIRMIADVPLGSMLSGGVDSSLITSLMCKVASGTVKTFSVGFKQSSHDEAGYAKAVAEHLGTNHHELYASAGSALKVVPLLPELYDEPFADSSQIPTYLVSSLARGLVTVGLSGDGGDEAFLGYSRYIWGSRIERLQKNLPFILRRGAGLAVNRLPTSFWAGLFGLANKLLPRSWQKHNPADNLSRIADALTASGPSQTALAIMSHWKDTRRLAIGAGRARTLFDENPPPALGRDLSRIMQYLDSATYLPDDILTKVDRAAMGVSLEVRSPLLDYRLVELSWQLPRDLLMRDGIGKWPLRRILYRHVPRELLDRPKAGFGVPLAQWLRGDLKDWAGDLLAPQRLARQRILEPTPVLKLWREHQKGIRDWHHHLWDVLMLESWLDSQKQPPRPVPRLDVRSDTANGGKYLLPPRP